MFSRLRALAIAFVFLLGLLAGAGTAVSFEPADMASCNEQSVSATDACGKATIHASCLYHGTCGLFLSPDPARIHSRTAPSARNTPLTAPLAGQPSAPETPPPISTL